VGTVRPATRPSRPDRGKTATPTSGGPSAGASGTAASPSSPGSPPVATNSWARRTILSRAQALGLPPELAKQVGSAGLWYYNRMVLLHRRTGAPDQELPPNTNRYLVPISLALACESRKRPVELDVILRLSGVPTPKTVETAGNLLAEYRKRLAAPRKVAAPQRETRGAATRPSAAPARRATPSEFRTRGPVSAAAPAPSKAPPSRAPSPRPGLVVVTSLAVPIAEIGLLRRLFPTPAPPTAGAGRVPPRARVQNTNAWARKRIADVARSLGLPDPVRDRSLQLYERIVDLHTERGHAPPGKRLQLSPRLNSSLVFTTIYLGCRCEEYPKELPDILGPNHRRGTLREVYGLYRFYKRELKLSINLVDVRTFILSWMDGYALSELLNEPAAAGDQAWLQKRAIEIANKARAATTLRKTSTKLIAAGALTTALAERDPPRNLRSFYRAVADLLRMSETTIRAMVERIAAIL
jgi:transcription initiation factor TFIIIB Brf1 subunit/transcription initiation factor TFIIB